MRRRCAWWRLCSGTGAVLSCAPLQPGCSLQTSWSSHTGCAALGVLPTPSRFALMHLGYAQAPAEDAASCRHLQRGLPACEAPGSLLQKLRPVVLHAAQVQPVSG